MYCNPVMEIPTLNSDPQDGGIARLRFMHNGIECYLVHHSMMHNGTLYMNYWCGYVVMPIMAASHAAAIRDMVYSIDVHGSVTYCESDLDAGVIVVGFDTAHFGDRNSNLVFDADYLMDECRKIADAVRDI